VTKEMWIEFFHQYRTRGNYTVKSSLNQPQYVTNVTMIVNDSGIDLVTKTVKGDTMQKYEYNASLDQFVQNLEQHFLVRTQ